MNTLNGALKSKIVWLAFAVALMGAIQAKLPALAPLLHLTPERLGVIDALLGVALIVARFFTDKSLAQKGTPQ